MEYYSAIKKEWVMPFAAIWMDLEIIIPSELNQRKINIIWYRLYVESKLWYKWTYLKNKHTDRHRKQKEYIYTYIQVYTYIWITLLYTKTNTTLYFYYTSIKKKSNDVGTVACLCVSHAQHPPARPLGLLLGLAPAGGSGFYFFNVSLSLCNYWIVRTFLNNLPVNKAEDEIRKSVV